MNGLLSLEPEGEAEKPEAIVSWSEAGLLRESVHPSLEGSDAKLFWHSLFFSQ